MVFKDAEDAIEDAVTRLRPIECRHWTKEKQRVGEALGLIDAQREQLVSRLRELEAIERVLARYTQSTQARKTSSAKMPTRVTVPAAPARPEGVGAPRPNTGWRQARFVKPERSGPCSGTRSNPPRSDFRITRMPASL
jgi:hypothetical protein